MVREVKRNQDKVREGRESKGRHEKVREVKIR